MVEPETPGVIFREGANAEEFPKQQVVSTYDNLDAAYNDPVVLKDMSDSVDKYIAENNLLPESVVFRDPDGFEIEIDGKIVRKEEITVQDLKNLREEKEFIKALDHCAIGGSRGK
jgi:DMSO/TMAO reductase YedYZ molybdopterin-dependent catalytic subunit